jgi:hypothetical protein
MDGFLSMIFRKPLASRIPALAIVPPPVLA